MKLKAAILSIHFVLLATNAFSQKNEQTLKKINIGDRTPEYTLKNLINFDKPSVKFSTLRDKVVILDFWNFYCTACIKSWPKLIALQEQFKDKIQIILVNTESNADQVKSFITKQQKIHGYKMSLPVACGDTSLKRLFPHDSYPHVVYIDTSGIVRYKTTNVTAGLIQAVLDNKKFNIPSVSDDYVSVNWSLPFCFDAESSPDTFKVNSILTSIIFPYSPKIRPGAEFVDSTLNILNGRTYGVMSNWPLESMFRYLYGREYNFVHHIFSIPKSKLVFKNVDTSRLVRMVEGIPRSENLYTIQLTARNNITIDGVRRKMIMDLEQNFSLKTYWEKQKKLCLVIAATNLPIPKYEKGLDSLNIGGKILDFNNITMLDLIDRLTYFTPSLKSYPVVDETKFYGKLGRIRLTKTDVINHTKLGEALSKHGMTITLQEREVDMLVIERDDAADQKKQ
ncbi:MAG: TlpA disulfide reductase family protein [Bacteroidota bacterium]